MNSDKMDWRDSGFDRNLMRLDNTPKSKYIGGADFGVQLDDLLFNKMIRLKNLSQAPQGYEPGKIYWDKENEKFKIWVNNTGKWADVLMTTTSTT